MRGTYAAAVAGMIAALIGDAHADPTARSVSLFGLTLGSPSTIAACALPKQQFMCLVPDQLVTQTLGKNGGVWYDVHYDPAKRPDYAARDYFEVEIANGLVEEITIFTTGIASQREVLDKMVAKFGWPKEGGEQRKIVVHGSSFNSLFVKWHIGNDRVVWISAQDGDGLGIIGATTNDALRDAPGTPQL